MRDWPRSRENLDVRADRDLGRKREKFMAVLPRVIRGNLVTGTCEEIGSG